MKPQQKAADVALIALGDAMPFANEAAQDVICESLAGMRATTFPGLVAKARAIRALGGLPKLFGPEMQAITELRLLVSILDDLAAA